MGYDPETGKKILCIREFRNKENLKNHIRNGTNHSSTCKDPR